MSNQDTYDPTEGEQAVEREAYQPGSWRTEAPSATDWRSGLWAVLDIENTGFSEHDKIVEIAIVMMREGRVVEAWSSLVNPGMPIPPEATAVHGITDAMVATAPSIADLRVEVLLRIRKAAVLVGYNIYTADLPWLERELPGVVGPVPVIDPLVIVRSEQVGKWWKGDFEKPCDCPVCDEARPEPKPKRKSSGRHRLSRAVEHFQAGFPEAGFEDALHRAAWDALLAGRVMWCVVRWCSLDAKVSEAKLRAEAARQDAEICTFKAKMTAEEEERRARMKASLALRVRDLEDEKASLTKRLDDVETYAAKLEAALGKSPFAGGVG